MKKHIFSIVIVFYLIICTFPFNFPENEEQTESKDEEGIYLDMEGVEASEQLLWVHDFIESYFPIVHDIQRDTLEKLWDQQRDWAKQMRELERQQIQEHNGRE